MCVPWITSLASVVVAGTSVLPFLLYQFNLNCTLLQALLVNAAKDVAQSLGDLISSTRAAAGKSVQDPSMEQLKDSARVRWQCQTA